MMKRYMHGELAPDAPKAPNEPMAIDPNAKIQQGATSGDGNDANGSSNGSSDLNPIELNEKLSDMILEDLKKPRKPTLN